MGNFFSSSVQTSSDQEIEQLKKRLVNLENLDRNGDGNVSKDEMKLWVNGQKKDIENLKASLEKNFNEKHEKALEENQEQKGKIKELEQQIESLESINDNLKNDMANMKKREFTNLSSVDDGTKAKLSELSQDRINGFVEELLNDKNVNIKYLPDFVEKQIYRNVFGILIGLLDNVMETTNVQFLGHKLTFDIQPQTDDEAIALAEQDQEQAPDQDQDNTITKSKSKLGGKKKKN